MEPLRNLGPSLDERRLALRKVHVMSEITKKTKKPRQRPRAAAILVATGLSLAVTGGVALAANQLHGAIWRQDDGSVAIDGVQLRPAYEGHYLSSNELKDLQAHGKAMASANDPALACQGISLYFDTEAERDAYNADFDARYPIGSDQRGAGEDPCAPYADWPSFVTLGE